MITNLTVDDIVQFEEEVKQAFREKKIRAPIHLQCRSHIRYLLKVFEYINEHDYIFTTWRSHAECLLKGVPQNELMDAILAGKSISLCFPDYKVYSSAIVGGNLPIAVGVALGEKWKSDRNTVPNNVFAFCGEMTAETGTFMECVKYSRIHKLPITFVVSDNGKSVCTPTWQVWGDFPWFWNEKYDLFDGIKVFNPYRYYGRGNGDIYYFKYDMGNLPHSGLPEGRIQF